ncbi:MAG: endolytic transglycosylase MltG [Parcubacteria group bacterium]|nr:endolytic transglycosylase MltG [Parcubacteria group bacterium]
MTRIMLLGSGIFIFIAVLAVFFIFSQFFGAPKSGAATEWFVIPLKADRDTAIAKLYQEGFVKSRTGISFALSLRGFASGIPAGGYPLAKSMNAFEIAGVISKGPQQKWVSIPEGLRKEEIAEILAKTLGWDNPKTQEFLSAYKKRGPEYAEGVYFPNTYLVPKADSGDAVAKRMMDGFNEELAKYAGDLMEQNIKWTTAVKIASLIQREAAGGDDMPVISGIIWNRLLRGMKLDIDATIQYARGSAQAGWWPPVKSDDKKIDSPYNTYLYAGLPPTPIDNPGTKAIKAAISPQDTKCFFYLHDAERKIHCAATYEEHLKNIDKYLK